MRRLRLVRLCMVIVALAILTSSVASLAATVEITHFMYASHNELWKKYLDTMASRFEAQSGIKVNILPSDGDYRSKLLTMIAGGIAPDVTDAHPMLASPFIKDRMFEDLRPYVQRDKIRIDQMPPAALVGTTGPDGYLWGIPVSILPIVTIYNTDMFAKFGLQTPRQLGENWTWETLRSSAKRLTTDPNGDGISDTYGTSRIWYRWEAQVHQAGSLLYDRLINPSKSLWNAPEVLKGIEYLYTLRNVDKVVSLDYKKADMPQETVGFTVVDGPGTTFLPSSWDVAVPPKGPANRSSRVNPDGFQIVAESKQKDAAWKWIKFLVATPENQLEMSKITGRLPSLKEAMLRYPKVMPTLPDNWMAYIDTAFSSDGYPGYVLFNASVVDPIVNGALGQVWESKLSPTAALQQIHERVSAVFAGK